MTISSSENRIQYVGNGATDTYSTGTIIFYQNTDLIVTETVISTGVDTVLALTTDYTVTGGNGAAGSITLVAGNLPSTKRITIERAIPYEQNSDFVEGEAILAQELETAIDKTVVMAQQLNDGVERSVKIPATSTATSIELPNYSADKVLAWSATSSDEIENSTKTLSEIEGAVDSVGALVAASGVKVSSDDTTVGFLDGKLLAGSNVSFVVGNPGGDETITINASATSAPVDSVFGRTGAVVAAASDYDASQVDNDSGVSGSTVADALDTLEAAIPSVSGGSLIEIQYFTSSGIWTKPSGCNAVKVTVVGGGGGGGGDNSGGSAGGGGGTSSFGAFCSASGGGGGQSQSSGSVANGGSPGVGSGGSINIEGSAGGTGLGSGITGFGGGTTHGGSSRYNTAGRDYGGGGAAGGGTRVKSAGGGGGGGTAIEYITSGLGASETVTVGGAGSAGGDGGSAGASGLVIVEAYT